jgi:hypothetical protein
VIVTVRFVVLFCESFSTIRSERLADEELLQLCGHGAAADSAKFRTLCLRAKAERAAPIIFKAALHTVRTAFLDFTESFNSPAKIAMLLLFVVSGLALPVVKAITSLAAAHLGPDPLGRLHGLDEDNAEQGACEVVVLNGGRSSWARRLRPHMGRSRRARSLTLGGFGDEDEDDAGAEPAWSQIALGRAKAD